MKRYIYLFLAVMIMMPLWGEPVFAGNIKKAQLTQSTIFLDGREIGCTGFNVLGNNYFKLRDLAEYLSGTLSQFEVGWDNQNKAIEILTGASYTPVVTEYGYLYWGDNSYAGTLQDTRVVVDGKVHNITAFSINGSTYFKLRDLSQLLSLQMDWDPEGDKVLIYSNLPKNAKRVETAYDGVENMVSPYFPRWASTVATYTVDNQDGTISVIEASSDVTIEIYDAQYNLLANKSLAYELPIFGGFYRGEKYNYIAFGQNNIKEEANKEVIRIVRYDKDFKRIDSVSVTGGESFTVKPFDAAAGRMAEYGDQLVFHTSRERYKTEDGLNHQSQLTLIIDTATMKVTNDLGRFQSNHVSHSFDQYVLFDNNTHVLLDHADGYPRSVVLSKKTGSSYDTVDLFKIPGKIGANCTGVSVGGFENSGTHYMVAMNTIDHSLVKEYTSYEMVGLKKDQRDIILAMVAKDSLSDKAVKQVLIKKYVGTDKNASIPQLVKISENKLMVMWQEYNQDDILGDLNYVLIDGQGNMIDDIKTIKGLKLPKTKPVFREDRVIWHINEKGMRIFYAIPL